MRALLIASLFISSFAIAADISSEQCRIQEVLPGSDTTRAFVTFNNTTNHPIILKQAKIDSISKHVEIHQMTQKDGIMHMQKIAYLALKPGKTVFKHGSYHIMLMNITNVPALGSKHTITFTYADGTTTHCSATVISVEKAMSHMHQQPSTHTMMQKHEQ